jgi:hypothetical protein
MRTESIEKATVLRKAFCAQQGPTVTADFAEIGACDKHAA